MISHLVSHTHTHSRKSSAKTRIKLYYQFLQFFSKSQIKIIVTCVFYYE